MSGHPECQPEAAAPYVQAAFINAIADEGTKDEAIFWLQKQWNETCALRSRVEELTKALEKAEELYRVGLLNAPDGLAAAVVSLRRSALASSVSLEDSRGGK